MMRDSIRENPSEKLYRKKLDFVQKVKKYIYIHKYIYIYLTTSTIIIL